MLMYSGLERDKVIGRVRCSEKDKDISWKGRGGANSSGFCTTRVHNATLQHPSSYLHLPCYALPEEHYKNVSKLSQPRRCNIFRWLNTLG